jgi:hypothetical protein
MTETSFLKRRTCAEATAAFEAAAATPSALRAFISQDVLAMQVMAETLARAVHDVAVLFAGLDTARRTTNAKGAACAASFIAAEADEYALVEALFWDRLSSEAEILLKALLRKALRETRP